MFPFTTLNGTKNTVKTRFFVCLPQFCRSYLWEGAPGGIGFCFLSTYWGCATFLHILKKQRKCVPAFVCTLICSLIKSDSLIRHNSFLHYCIGRLLKINRRLNISVRRALWDSCVLRNQLSSDECRMQASVKSLIIKWNIVY